MDVIINNIDIAFCSHNSACKPFNSSMCSSPICWTKIEKDVFKSFGSLINKTSPAL